MAHFAKIENGIVTQVLAVSDEHESRGQEFLADDLALGGTWVQTSYNANIRGKFAGLGDLYDAENDIFVTPVDEEWEAELAAKQAQRQAVLDKLGLTLDEAKLLLGGN